MKKIVLMGIIISCTISTYAQNEISVGLTLPMMTNKSNSIDAITTFGGVISFSKYFKVNNNFRLNPKLNFAGNRIMTDGFFQKDNLGNYEFTAVGNDKKISSLVMYDLSVPILLKYKFIGDDKKGAGYFGFGPYINYLLVGKQVYKVNSEKYVENAPIQNRFNYGLSSELSLSSKLNTGDLLFLNAGLQYQMSNFINNKQSFNPLQLYCIIGIGF